MFGFGKTKKQLLALSDAFAKVSGFAQQNRIYVSQLQSENEYFRSIFQKLGYAKENRSEWLANEAEKEQKELNEIVRQKVADELAKKEIKK